jgi:hypothetical protein
VCQRSKWKLLRCPLGHTVVNRRRRWVPGSLSALLLTPLACQPHTNHLCGRRRLQRQSLIRPRSAHTFSMAEQLASQDAPNPREHFSSLDLVLLPPCELWLPIPFLHRDYWCSGTGPDSWIESMWFGFWTAAPAQRVLVTNTHGEKLVGLLHHMGSDKVVVLCHGFTGSKVYINGEILLPNLEDMAPQILIIVWFCACCSCNYYWCDEIWRSFAGL